HLVAVVEDSGTQRQSRIQLGAELVAVAQVVTWLERNRLAIIASDPFLFAFLDDVVVRDARKLLRQHDREPPRRTFFNDYSLGFGQVTGNVIVVADNLARRAVERFKPFVFTARVDEMRDAGGLELLRHVLVDESTAVVNLL